MNKKETLAQLASLLAEKFLTSRDKEAIATAIAAIKKVPNDQSKTATN